jgi:hypothetical protein
VNLLIRDGLDTWYPREARYRGTDRKVPTYCGAVPSDHEINQMFTMWYLEEGGDAGVVHDLSKARRYADLCNVYFADQHFEVIESADGGRIQPEDNRQFLGFDLSRGGCYQSLITMALLYEPKRSLPQEPIFVLSELIRSHFLPKLNEVGLFGSRQDATDCRAAMSALQRFRPGLYEEGSLEVFKISAIYLHWPLIA